MSDTAAKPEEKAKGVAPAVPPAPVVANAVKPKTTDKPVAKAPIAKPAAPKPAPAAKAPALPVVTTTPTFPAAPAAISAAKEIPMADTISTVTDKTKTFIAEANERAKGAAEKGAKAFEDMGAFQKGNLEAMVESSKIAAKGAENIAKYSVEYAKGTVEKANANVRKLAAVKSPTEFFQLQTELAREAMDAVASEGAKFTENYLKLLGEIAQPYQNRFAVAAEKMKAAA